MTLVSSPVRYDIDHVTQEDLLLFREGTHYRIHEKLGAHLIRRGGDEGVHFAVWAPGATAVSVMGEFNGWSPVAHPLRLLGDSGVWAGFVPGAAKGAMYKYRVVSRSGQGADKADPLALLCEVPPATASIVWDLGYSWEDQGWMEVREHRASPDAPMAIYEVHLGSWRRSPEEGNRRLNYREMAPLLASHVKALGFTHVELLPVMEHPFHGSWGYGTTGYFAPSSRYGTPQDFMYLMDHLHREGIGVIIDWVPAHFPTDPHALSSFDGSPVYEHEDPRRGYHPDWHTAIFNYGRGEVRSFLASSALFWLEEYHADGLRVDGVASMLYLDYSRKPGEWVPNQRGGRENLEAIDFLRQLNGAVRKYHPDAFTVAEESTAWPGVSRPTEEGGLGFWGKWDMGWMHDTLQYMSREVSERKKHQSELTFRMVYAFSENYVLPLSHDEVSRGKGSLVGKMPGNEWEKRAGLRLLLGYMYAQPGKKLLFMGGEFGQWREWDHDQSLDWHVMDAPGNAGIQRWVRDLNEAYRREGPLHALDFRPEGFQWVDASDCEQSVLSFLRKGRSARDVILTVCNFTTVPRHDYRIGVPSPGFWREILNSDASIYGGSGRGNMGGAEASPVPFHKQGHSVSLTLPPLSILFFKLQ